MAARLPVTGPAELFISITGAGGPYLFWGTDLGEPHIQLIPTFSPTFNDYGGDAPFDDMFMAEEGMIAMNLSRWDAAVYASIASRPTPGLTPGRNVFGDVGTLVVQGGSAFQAVVRFPFVSPVATASNIAAGLPAGYRFFACELVGPDDMKIGTRTEILQVIIRARRVFVPRDAAAPAVGLPAGVASAIPGGFALYDNVMPTLPVPS